MVSLLLFKKQEVLIETFKISLFEKKKTYIYVKDWEILKALKSLK